MADLVKFREKFMVPAEGAIEVRVTFAADNMTGKLEPDAWYLCVSCDEICKWCPDVREWQCLSCGYSMTADEAVRLCENHISVVRKLAFVTAEKKGWIWRLLRFFGIGRKRGAALSI